MKILGVMTGTSCDALDAACVLVGKNKFRLLWTDTKTYPSNLKSRVLEIQKPKSTHSLEKILILDRDLGIWYGRTLNQMIASRAEIPDVIANHGQTVAHFPYAKNGGVTLQLGNPAWIAKHTGLTLISNFRIGDMSASGQGAPLVPVFHKFIAQKLHLLVNKGVVFHNIGGISNFTYMGPRGTVIALDTGPGNIWIDAATEFVTKKKYDKGGKLALLGKTNEKVLNKLLRHPFFKKPPPKSCGRDDFTASMFLREFTKRTPDVVTTATMVSVRSIILAYERWILKRKLPLGTVYFCGGGAKNDFLLKEIQKLLPKAEVKTIEDLGFDSKYMEAQAFAYLGYLVLQGKTLTGSWTGAQGYVPSAQILPGKKYKS
ncbi:MAG: anhydro-N-acetylmuramic acid kinase [Deltaproteobacteria bacterium]|nr:anhydro-N-acetylmuramic acid kinase [Deltaproteobacteria bacterium]